jgi:SMI1 / KNR4 family (SUKH-1)
MSKYREKIETLCLYKLESSQPSMEVIQEIEQELECQLPNDYIDFVLNYGGYTGNAYLYSPIIGNFPGNRDSMMLVGEEVLVESFLAIRAEGSLDLLDTYYSYKGRMPFNFLPIATSYGDAICLSIRGEDYGSVYFWDHVDEEDVDEEEGEEPGYSNVYLLAKSFDDFISTLRHEEP